MLERRWANITPALVQHVVFAGLHKTMASAVMHPYSAGIDISRQNLTTKIDPRPERVDISLITVDP